MDVSIVIPTKNNEATIGRALDSLSRQHTTRLLEVVVVDDCSGDDSLQIIESHPLFRSGVVRIMRNPSGGLAAAYNAGARASRGALLIYMHGDCYIDGNDGMDLLLAPFKDGAVVGVQSKTIIPEALWGTMSFWDRVTNARYVGKEAYAFGGKFDGVRKCALESIGWFDQDRFYSAGEDCDIVIRLRKVGQIVKTDARVVHAHQHPPGTRLVSVMRKQAQLGEAMGALLRKHGLNREYAFALSSHLGKVVLMVMLALPGVRWLALAALLILGAIFSLRAFAQPDWRIVLIPFVNVCQFAVFVMAMLAGMVKGRQRANYQ